MAQNDKIACARQSLGEEIDAARRRAGLMRARRACRHAAGRLRHLLSEWALAEVAPGRLVPWLPVAFGFGIVGYFTADREPAWWAASGLALAGIAIAFTARRRAIGFPLALAFAAIAARLCHRDLEDRAHRASGAADDGVERQSSPASSKSARSASAATASSSTCIASKDGAAHREDARPHPRRGAQGHGAGGRQFCRVEGASVAAARAVAARRLRLRARHVFPAHRRLRLCARRDQDRGATGRARSVAALRLVHRRSARGHRQAHPRRGAGRPGLDCVGADHGKTRRDFDAGQRRDVHLEPRACAVDLRLSHGGGGRHRVLLHPRGVGADPVARHAPADQEMGGGSARSSPPRSICCCRAPRSPRNAPSS